MTGFLFGGGSGTTVTATGSTTARSMSDRAADVTNVKDFGALGNSTNGSDGADDTAAIQAAIGSTQNKGIIFFPPGMYRITSSLSIGDTGSGGDNTSFVLQGCGQASKIVGSFSDFLLKKPDTTGSGSSDVVQVIRDLWLVNASTNAASGCLYFFGSMVKIQNCSFTGITCVDVSENSLSDVSKCVMRSSGTRAGVGLAMGGECTAYNLDIVGMDTGIRAWGICGSIFGCRIEFCGDYALALGVLADGTSDTANGYLVSGNSLEGNGGGIFARSLNSCHVSCNVIHGETANNSFNGITENGCSSTTFSNNLSYGDFGVAGTSIKVGVSGDAEGSGVLFENCEATAASGTAWVILNGTNAQFRGCNMNYATTFANAPSSPRDGDHRIFSDSNTAVFGAQVAGGGANRVVGRYSSNAAHWYVTALAP